MVASISAPGLPAEGARVTSAQAAASATRQATRQCRLVSTHLLTGGAAMAVPAVPSAAGRQARLRS
ncbi:hypothetical protein ACU4GD_35040 [Cupriavidus basilensis]